VSKVFDAVPDMPPCYDASALVDELARMNLFAIEMRDFGAALVVGRKYRSGGLGIDKSPVRRSCWNDGGGGPHPSAADRRVGIPFAMSTLQCRQFQLSAATPRKAPRVGGN
jgi:hypothetical protein